MSATDPSKPSRPVALVTGASRGIGAALGAALAADGHPVAWLARSAEALERQVAAHGGLAVPVDLTDDAAIDAAVDRVIEELGPVGVLVNNAGIAESAAVDRTSDDLWARTMQINLNAPFRIARRCVPGMKKAGWGRVIFIASNAGLTGYRYTSAYCASKHGVVGLMRAMAVELARTGITVNAVCPGFVETDMARNAIQRIMDSTGRSEDEAKASLASLSPQSRLIQVEEVVHQVMSLLPEAARGVHGQALAVDGGQVLH